jgi:hypothetical protein
LCAERALALLRELLFDGTTDFYNVLEDSLTRLVLSHGEIPASTAKELRRFAALLREASHPVAESVIVADYLAYHDRLEDRFARLHVTHTDLLPVAV